MCSLNELNEDNKITLKTILLVSKRALKYIFKDKSASYQDLLQGIQPPSMETPKNPGHAIDNKQ